MIPKISQSRMQPEILADSEMHEPIPEQLEISTFCKGLMVNPSCLMLPYTEFIGTMPNKSAIRRKNKQLSSEDTAHDFELLIIQQFMKGSPGFLDMNLFKCFEFMEKEKFAREYQRDDSSRSDYDYNPKPKGLPNPELEMIEIYHLIYEFFKESIGHNNRPMQPTTKNRFSEVDKNAQSRSKGTQEETDNWMEESKELMNGIFESRKKIFRSIEASSQPVLLSPHNKNNNNQVEPKTSIYGDLEERKFSNEPWRERDLILRLHEEILAENLQNVDLDSNDSCTSYTDTYDPTDIAVSGYSGEIASPKHTKNANEQAKGLIHAAIQKKIKDLKFVSAEKEFDIFEAKLKSIGKGIYILLQTDRKEQDGYLRDTYQQVLKLNLINLLNFVIDQQSLPLPTEWVKAQIMNNKTCRFCVIFPKMDLRSDQMLKNYLDPEYLAAAIANTSQDELIENLKIQFCFWSCKHRQNYHSKLQYQIKERKVDCERQGWIWNFPPTISSIVYWVQSDGSVYLGETKNGMKHGTGLAIGPNSSAFLGYWRENEKLETLDHTYVKGDLCPNSMSNSISFNSKKITLDLNGLAPNTKNKSLVANKHKNSETQSDLFAIDSQWKGIIHTEFGDSLTEGSVDGDNLSMHLDQVNEESNALPLNNEDQGK